MWTEWAGRWSGDKLRFIFLLLLPVLIGCIDYHSTNDHFTFCLFKNVTGRDCYGCGVLRGLSAVLHLNFRMAVQLNKLNIVTIPLLAYLYGRELHKASPYRRSAA
jgi:hypothetical protein